jgi:hypothetical protein
MSVADRIADMQTVAGFLIPVYAEDPLPGREVTYALTPSDMRKTQAGYACPRCLADYGGIYRVTCPMCLHERDVEQDFRDIDPMWQQHFDRSRNLPVEHQKRPTVDQALDRIMRDPNVEHATISQLKPPKWGRGRPK